ncbi:MAG: hypothetical protein IKC12_02850 [Alistipes sp.]|nr:hypothetical protein [Alistipes sp.]
MSFFRPPKRKPRQFNYIPRYYDPVKEERDRRRRELHGTSAIDDEPYAPGKYIRTQREARDASRGDRSSLAGVGRIVLVGALMVFAIIFFLPRFVSFAERAAEEKMMVSEQSAAVHEGDTTSLSRIILYEKHGDIDFREFESLTPEVMNEIDEWNRQHPKINIYDDDVKIVDGRRVIDK